MWMYNYRCVRVGVLAPPGVFLPVFLPSGDLSARKPIFRNSFYSTGTVPVLYPDRQVFFHALSTAHDARSCLAHL